MALDRDPCCTSVDTSVSTDVQQDRKSTRLNSSHANISYAVFCLKKKKIKSTSPYLPAAIDCSIVHLQSAVLQPERDEVLHVPAAQHRRCHARVCRCVLGADSRTR